MCLENIFWTSLCGVTKTCIQNMEYVVGCWLSTRQLHLWELSLPSRPVWLISGPVLPLMGNGLVYELVNDECCENGCTNVTTRREAKGNLFAAAGTNMLTNSNELWLCAIHFGATGSHLLHHSLFTAAAPPCASRSHRCYASFPPPPSLSTKGHNKEPLKTFYFTAAAAVSPLAQPIIQFNVTLSSHRDAPASARGRINDCTGATPVSAHWVSACFPSSFPLLLYFYCLCWGWRVQDETRCLWNFLGRRRKMWSHKSTLVDKGHFRKVVNVLPIPTAIWAFSCVFSTQSTESLECKSLR